MQDISSDTIRTGPLSLASSNNTDSEITVMAMLMYWVVLPKEVVYYSFHVFLLFFPSVLYLL